MSRLKGDLFRYLFESQSGTLACNGAVFSDCSERIVGNPEVIHLGGDGRQFPSLSCSHLLSHRLEVPMFDRSLPKCTR